MPTSKKRKTTPRAPQPVRPAGPATLETATLALTQAGLELVREAELRITAAARAGEGVDEALAVHHDLRTGVLGILSAWSRLSGNPDPVTGEPFGQD